MIIHICRTSEQAKVKFDEAIVNGLFTSFMRHMREGIDKFGRKHRFTWAHSKKELTLMGLAVEDVVIETPDVPQDVLDELEMIMQVSHPGSAP